MDKSKYGKYIVTDISKFKMEAPLPFDPNVDHNFLVINDEAVKGSFFSAPLGSGVRPLGRGEELMYMTGMNY